MPRRSPSSMQRTTVMLPAALRRRAFAAAKRRRISFGEVIRESLDATLPDAAPVRAEDPLFADDAVFAGKAPRDLSLAHDRHLYGDGV